MSTEAAAGSTEPPASTESRQRTSTLRRSCESCRAVKAKCVVETVEASGDTITYCISSFAFAAIADLGVLSRCLNHGYKCVFENALARPKKLKYSARTRVKDVEEKLDGLIALISAKQTSEAQMLASAAAAAASSKNTTPSPAADAASAVPSAVFAPGDADFAGERSATNNDSDTVASMFAPANAAASHDAASGDVIDRGIISEELAQRLLADYVANAQSQFPFILLPTYASVSYMRRERPSLFLAVSAVAAQGPIQARLAMEFRKLLAQSMIIESKNSLDLLQGLLIFCVWFHQYSRSFSTQLYQLSQIAVSISMDIDLPSIFREQSMPLAGQLHHAASSCTRNNTNEFFDEIERARTYLGAYCLSANLAMAYGKPTHFVYDLRVESACQFLEAANEAPTDLLVVPYQVRACKLAEDIIRVLRAHHPIGVGNMDEVFIDTMVKNFELQYSQLRDSLPPEAWNNASLKSAVLYIPSAIYEVGLKVPAAHHSLLTASPGTLCCNWCASQTRFALIVKTIRATQDYLDSYLDLPVSVVRQATVMEISRHIDCCMLLTRCGLGLDTKHYELANMGHQRASLAALADVLRYLDASDRKIAAVVAHNRAAAPGGHAAGPDETWGDYCRLRMLFGMAMAWYRKNMPCNAEARRQIDNMSAEESAPINVPSMFWLAKSDTMQSKQCGSIEENQLEDTAPLSSGIDHDSTLLFQANQLHDTTLSKGSETTSPDTGSATESATESTADSTVDSAMDPTVELSSVDPMVSSLNATASADAASAPALLSGLMPDNGLGFDPSNFSAGMMDGEFSETLPTWGSDQPVDVWANMPPMASSSTWFDL